MARELSFRMKVSFPRHPKVRAVGPLAGWLHMCGIAHAAEHLTDGFVHEQEVERLAIFSNVFVQPPLFAGDPAGTVVPVENATLAELLVANGLWHETDGGFQIHDFTEYQRSRARVLADRARKRTDGLGAADGAPSARLKPSVPAHARTRAGRGTSGFNSEVSLSTGGSGGERGFASQIRPDAVPLQEPALVGAGRSESPSRPRDERWNALWQLLEREFGEARTRSERRRRADAVRELHAAGATADEAERAVAQARKTWDRVSDSAVAARFGSLLSAEAPSARDRKVERVRQLQERREAVA